MFPHGRRWFRYYRLTAAALTTFTKEVIAMIAEITKVFIMVLFFKLYILFQVLVFGGVVPFRHCKDRRWEKAFRLSLR